MASASPARGTIAAFFAVKKRAFCVCLLHTRAAPIGWVAFFCCEVVPCMPIPTFIIIFGTL